MGPQQLLEMYRNMAMIRHFDQRAVEEFHAGNIPGVVHAYIGEEAVAVGANGIVGAGLPNVRGENPGGFRESMAG